MASAFDTLEAAKQLEGCGFEREQAETVVAVVQSARSDLTTKDDLKALEAALTNTIKLSQAETEKAIVGIETAMAELKTDVLSNMTMRALGIAGLVATVLFGLIIGTMFFLLRFFMGQG